MTVVISCCSLEKGDRFIYGNTINRSVPLLPSCMTPLLAGKDASAGAARAGEYARHRPEQTRLYPLNEAHYPAFVAHLTARARTLPVHVQREFEDYLKCGRLEDGPRLLNTFPADAHENYHRTQRAISDSALEAPPNITPTILQPATTNRPVGALKVTGVAKAHSAPLSLPT